MTRSNALARLLILAALLALGGCSSISWFNKDDPLESLPVEGMYQEAKRSLENGNYGRAVRYYRRLVSRFPYGEYTEQAQLELAYARYKNGQASEALSTLDRFIKTYPTHRHIDYAQYLRALVNFSRDASFLDRIARIDLTERDLGNIRQSFNDFGELIRRYPNSRYAVDARQRMVHLRNLLARHEIGVASYYLRRDAWVAAANRAHYLVEHFPQSEYVPDALAVIAESYTRLGEESLAADARRVLELNDPQHPYLSGAWPARPSFWRRLLPFGGDEI